MVLNNVPPLTETRARPAVRFPSSNYTYSIWTQQYRTTWAGSTFQISSSACLVRKAVPQESRATCQVTGMERAEASMLPALWRLPSEPCLSAFPLLTVIVKKGESEALSFSLRSDRSSAMGLMLDASCCTDGPQASCLVFVHRKESKMR